MKKILGVSNVVLTAHLVRGLSFYTSSVRGIQTLNVWQVVRLVLVGFSQIIHVKRTSHKAEGSILICIWVEGWI